MRITAIIFILLFTYNPCFSQGLKDMINDSIVFDQTIHKRLYEFEIPESPFSVTLIEISNGNFKATININVYRRYEKVNDHYVGRLQIGKNKIKRLFKELDQNAFEQLNQPTAEENCSIYLDGDSAVFTITTLVIRKTMHFDGIYLDSFKDDCESNLKAQKILNLLNKELDFEWQIENFKNVLPPGNYSYMTGIVINKFVVE